MNLIVLPYALTICKLSSIDDLDPGLSFFAAARTEKEISLVCKTSDVPGHT